MRRVSNVSQGQSQLGPLRPLFNNQRCILWHCLGTDGGRVSELLFDLPALSPSDGGYRVLARKYRPRRFQDVVGQESLVRLLTQALRQNRLPHGFLFSGIRGIGKTTTARLLACALNCSDLGTRPGKEAEPCGCCPSCLAFAQDKHLDIVEMDAASHTGVDDIREILESCRYQPLVGKYKIFLIDEVHMLSKSAFNALLKTLEEPPPHVKFIFATTEVHKIPATVISRCLRFELKRMDPNVLVPYLAKICAQEGFSAEEDALFLLARSGGGSARDSLSLLDQAMIVAQGGGETETPSVLKILDVVSMLGLLDRQALGVLFEAVLKGEVSQALAQADFLATQGADPQSILGELTLFAHQLSCLKVGAKEILKGLTEGEQAFLETWAPQVSLPALGRLWQMLLKGSEELAVALFPQKALEMVLIRLAYVSPLPTPDVLLQEGVSPLSLSSPGQETRDGAPLFPTFESVILAAQKDREALLSAYLQDHVMIHHWAQGHLTLSVTQGAPADLVRRLERFLHQKTGARWQVTVGSGGGSGETVRQQARNAQQKLKDNALLNPVLQEAQSHFPGLILEEIQND